IGAFVSLTSSSLGAAASNLKPPVTAVCRACLLASSFTVQRAAGGGARWWLTGTMVLGPLFLFGQANEYLRLFRQNVTISQSVFGTTFFTLTGIHGLHVLGGIALLAIVLGLNTQRTAVETVAMYWHFVDGVWLVIFAVVYLWTFL